MHARLAEMNEALELARSREAEMHSREAEMQSRASELELALGEARDRLEI